jgi:hypothetical protein
MLWRSIAQGEVPVLSSVKPDHAQHGARHYPSGVHLRPTDRVSGPTVAKSPNEGTC